MLPGQNQKYGKYILHDQSQNMQSDMLINNQVAEKDKPRSVPTVHQVMRRI